MTSINCNYIITKNVFFRQNNSVMFVINKLCSQNISMKMSSVGQKSREMETTAHLSLSMAIVFL